MGKCHTFLQPQNKYLFEVSIEMCNPKGGVYRVLESKAHEMALRYGECYIGFGPFHPEHTPSRLLKEPPPKWLRPIFNRLLKRGIRCLYGHWNLPEKPRLILVDATQFKEYPQLKKKLERHFKTSLDIKHSFHNSLLKWAGATGLLLEALLALPRFRQKTVVHFHTWESITALMYLKWKKSEVPTVYTTHDTALGRQIALNGLDLFAKVHSKKRFRTKEVQDPLGYHTRMHYLQHLAGQLVDTYTAVSDATSEESGYVLERAADVVTPNGLSLDTFPKGKSLDRLRKQSRQRMDDFLQGYFLPYGPIETKNALCVFTAGRYEIESKGYDLFFDVLGKLNRKLRKAGKKAPYVFAFTFIVVDQKGPCREALENASRWEALHYAYQAQGKRWSPQNISHWLHDIPLKKWPHDEWFQQYIAPLLMQYRQPHEHAPVVGFSGLAEDDPLLACVRRNDLNNGPDDRVRVIIYPAAVNAGDNLMRLRYYEAVAGMDLGLYPSRYEPWGYTPVETLALGVPAVSTGNTGFATFIEHHFGKPTAGLYIAPHDHGSDRRSRNYMVELLEDFAYRKIKVTAEDRRKAKTIAKLTDWDALLDHYIMAHNLAYQKRVRS